MEECAFRHQVRQYGCWGAANVCCAPANVLPGVSGFLLLTAGQALHINSWCYEVNDMLLTKSRNALWKELNLLKLVQNYENVTYPHEHKWHWKKIVHNSEICRFFGKIVKQLTNIIFMNNDFMDIKEQILWITRLLINFMNFKHSTVIRYATREKCLLGKKQTSYV